MLERSSEETPDWIDNFNPYHVARNATHSRIEEPAHPGVSLVIPRGRRRRLCRSDAGAYRMGDDLAL